ncbi:MAG: ThuA domain-containing protein [Actinomycetota bacterium]|nr:ThuA domain-containing protein [Actinomycetota bacterium]MDA2970589.1 ThuA domain-containing protein [Actinomycetota bacterium]MDA3001922.1 ThuA domain-containing protein [Actinomycetota bacterium]
MSAPGHRIDVTLVAGGKYHDIDFARRELLGLLAEHDEFRVRVQPDYEDTSGIVDSSILVSYTCDVRPSEAAQKSIRAWVEAGGRWVALHGTNAALTLGGPNGVDSPRVFPLWADTLGSQFVAHPPIQPYSVQVTDPSHWLVAGIEPFETDDELYLSEYADRRSLRVLLHTEWQGDAAGFVEHDWSACDPMHPVMYVRDLGSGAVLYNTLGHCRGHYDMAPVLDYYPRVERCSWEKPAYYELLRRSLRWARGLDA